MLHESIGWSNGIKRKSVIRLFELGTTRYLLNPFCHTFTALLPLSMQISAFSFFSFQWNRWNLKWTEFRLLVLIRIYLLSHVTVTEIAMYPARSTCPFITIDLYSNIRPIQIQFNMEMYIWMSSNTLSASSRVRTTSISILRPVNWLWLSLIVKDFNQLNYSQLYKCFTIQCTHANKQKRYVIWPSPSVNIVYLTAFSHWA